MPRKKGASKSPPGVLCFSLDNSGSINKRARYEPGRRKEVAEVRAIGACLRCQLMKMPCSGGRPCSRCAQALLSAQASSHLWLLSCVPSALAGLQRFFKADIPIDNAKIDTMLGKNNRLVLSSVFLEFDEKVNWDITALSTDWALWLSQHNRIPVMSKVGIMSSLHFQQIVSPLISNNLASCFRLMMHTSSIIYSLGPQDSYCGIALDNFYTLRSHAGTHVLMGLERLIRPAELANASQEKLRVIFLLLFGTILAVLYNERIEDRATIMLLFPDGDERASAQEFSQLREQLVLVLAHRLIEVADRLNLLENGVSKQQLIDSAKQQWHLPANFVWQDSLIPFESAMSKESSVCPRLSSLCRGQMKHLEGRCSYYTFDPSARYEDRVKLFTRPPTVPIIMERDTVLHHSLACTPSVPTCRTCGIALLDGLPDMICYACAFFDWELFDSAATDPSSAWPLAQSNSGSFSKDPDGPSPSSAAIQEPAKDTYPELGPHVQLGNKLQQDMSAQDPLLGLSGTDTPGIALNREAGRDFQDAPENQIHHKKMYYCAICAAPCPESGCYSCGGFGDIVYEQDIAIATDTPAQMGSTFGIVGSNSAGRSIGCVPAKIRNAKCSTGPAGVEPKTSGWRRKLSAFRAFLV